ncbi:hypothetical protein ACFPES_00020 [Paenibacillus sp. GCM10023248]|uniref:hypothetical protein n=1 Tax=unclassified Paenibacillus TaxID=185978 RepID=UPI0023782A63|nr:hypothetical protein [Paenibacillus sp. MAHUQ-63]MDD9265408.1 hypothetical protein [Paenibacillus sp. MAHUQ-63]
METLTIQEVCGWFEANLDKNILIKKEEQNDIDQVEIALQDVGLMSHSDSIDDYLSPQAILLHGSGFIFQLDDDKQPLPGDSFEIPLNGNFHGYQDENGMEINTEAASYSIKIQ